jgi:hypothetical protein
MNIERRLADAVYRSHFGAFVYAAFEALYPGQGLVSKWHIDAVCYCMGVNLVDSQDEGSLFVVVRPATVIHHCGGPLAIISL